MKVAPVQINNTASTILQIGIALTVLYLIYKLTKTVTDTTDGIKDTVTDTTDRFGITVPDEVKALKTLPYLKTNYYVGTEPPTHTYHFFYDLAEKIYNAKTGSFYTNDDEILGAFQTLTNRKDVSYLARVFFYNYNRDLLNYFYSPMTNANLVTLYNFLTALPK